MGFYARGYGRSKDKAKSFPHLLEIYSPLEHKDKPRNVCYMREVSFSEISWYSEHKVRKVYSRYAFTAER